MKLCKCGICIDDCDYHKPEPFEWWKEVGFISNKDWKLPEGYVLIEFGNFSDAKD